MPRLFVAVWPPPAVVDALTAPTRVDAPGLRFTTKDQWHATLRFLGSCAEADAIDALRGVRFETATVQLGPTIERLGSGLVVAPLAGLDAIATAVRQATAAVGEPVDPRPFVGHVTLARLKDGGPCSLDGAAVGGTFTVQEIALVRSDLHHDGARYTTVATVAAEP
ncbi:MAG: RNA 2',3'-cyclic phosphodiesterase [Acidimicrobiales bacterium]|nr:MAG: RNA 2',3'-cyclic phosphodiesterase [Acidimicrobiales bacterium]